MERAVASHHARSHAPALRLGVAATRYMALYRSLLSPARDHAIACAPSTRGCWRQWLPGGLGLDAFKRGKPPPWQTTPRVAEYGLVNRLYRWMTAASALDRCQWVAAPAVYPSTTSLADAPHERFSTASALVVSRPGFERRSSGPAWYGRRAEPRQATRPWLEPAARATHRAAVPGCRRGRAHLPESGQRARRSRRTARCERLAIDRQRARTGLGAHARASV
jgi:hypothetical protein